MTSRSGGLTSASAAADLGHADTASVFAKMQTDILHPPARSDIDPALLEAILPIMMEKGLKATTMDTVAKSLHMSKRTLYEIFENKNDMIIQVIDHNNHRMMLKMQEIVETSSNVMAALFTIFSIHRDYLRKVNTEYFRDMDRLYPEMRLRHDSCRGERQEGILSILRRGVSQGVFRDDVNLEIQVKIMELQAESLKRSESLFPPEITLLEIYDTITIGFLRSIASAEGHRILDEMRKAREFSVNL